MPFPRASLAALSATCLASKLRDIVDELTFDNNVEVEGVFLGAPKQLTLHRSNNASHLPGSILQFISAHGVVVVFLCAPVSDTEWYVSEANFAADGEYIFDESLLMLADLSCEYVGSWGREASCKAQLLYEASQQYPEAAGRVISLGAMRAWLDRSRAANSKAEAADVADFFESFPFDWRIPEGWPSQAMVFYLWAWRWRDDKSKWHFAARRQTLNHAVNRTRDVSLPLPLRQYLDTLRAEELRRDPTVLAEPLNQLESEAVQQLRAEAAAQILRGEDAEESITKLIELGADLDLNAGSTERPLLSLCAFSGSLNNVHFLLERLASPNAEGVDGRSALHYACGRGESRIMTALLSAGADPMHTSITNATPAAETRLYCVSDKLEHVRKTLKEHGYVEDDRESWLWEHRKMKDRNDVIWRFEQEDVEMYPLPR